MKKQYEKPSIKAYELNRRSLILCGSPDSYNRDFGYTPGVNEDMNKTT